METIATPRGDDGRDGCRRIRPFAAAAGSGRIARCGDWTLDGGGLLGSAGRPVVVAAHAPLSRFAQGARRPCSTVRASPDCATTAISVAFLRTITFIIVAVLCVGATPVRADRDPAAPAAPKRPDGAATNPTERLPTPRAAVVQNGEPVTQALDPYVPWYRGKYGHNRVVHLGITAGLGLAYLASETVLKPTFAATTCRWCDPPGFEVSVRDALVWHDTKRASFLSTMDAYVLAPIVGFGLLIVSDSDASWPRLIDDTLPVAETIAVSQVITQVVKFSVGRQRPYAHFGDPNARVGSDDNTSFISGHSVLGFSITASAGLICHWRGYWTEPYVWGAGIAISLSTEYLRMGADKHYLSDVLGGGALGIASGLLVPRLMRRDIKIAPIANGAAVVGVF